MPKNPIIQKYNRRVDVSGSLLCVGLDSEIERIPSRFLSEPLPQFAFNRWIIDETAPYAAAFKPNTAFYEARGAEGLDELRMTAEYLQENYPGIVTVCDAKRADIGNTNKGYVTFIFDWLGFDAVTLHPYLGADALAPFLERTDKACIILCRTSNRGAGDIQDMDCGGRPLWQAVAEKVRETWNVNGNCMLVVGATYPEEMRKIRAIAPELTFLVPGVGAQGGEVASVVAAGLDVEGKGLMISSSRGIIFSDDPAGAARALRDEINAARKAIHVAH